MVIINQGVKYDRLILFARQEVKASKRKLPPSNKQRCHAKQARLQEAPPPAKLQVWRLFQPPFAMTTASTSCLSRNI